MWESQEEGARMTFLQEGPKFEVTPLTVTLLILWLDLSEQGLIFQWTHNSHDVERNFST